MPNRSAMAAEVIPSSARRRHTVSRSVRWYVSASRSCRRSSPSSKSKDDSSLRPPQLLVPYAARPQTRRRSPPQPEPCTGHRRQALQMAPLEESHTKPHRRRLRPMHMSPAGRMRNAVILPWDFQHQAAQFEPPTCRRLSRMPRAPSSPSDSPQPAFPTKPHMQNGESTTSWREAVNIRCKRTTLAPCAFDARQKHGRRPMVPHRHVPRTPSQGKSPPKTSMQRQLQTQ